MLCIVSSAVVSAFDSVGYGRLPELGRTMLFQ